MPESDLDQLIAPVYKKYENPATTILAAAGDLQIHLRARCATEGKRRHCWRKWRSHRAAAGRPHLLAQRPIARRGGRRYAARAARTLSVAESCTGGLLGERITSVPGSSAYFLGGFITYTNRMKVDWLGVPEEIIAEFGAVSKETAEAMALGARRRTGSTYALAITGVAGPDGGTEKKPVGTVYVGWRTRRLPGAAPPVHRRPDAHPPVCDADGAGYAAAKMYLKPAAFWSMLVAGPGETTPDPARSLPLPLRCQTIMIVNLPINGSSTSNLIIVRSSFPLRLEGPA
jgi:PncC family amidohydrolase